MNAAFDPRLPEALLPWYDANARDLPWRKTDDPYAIMVSEFMLQQTQVKTVIPYYHSFLTRFPSFAALADAPVEEVLEAWKGLGYYRRARNLHAAAKAIVERFGGNAPDEWDAMRSLPGIGDYTAAAVLSIAFGKPHPVVDGNVIRVGARLLASDEPADSTRLRRRIGDGLSTIIPKERPGDFNQAMMELGATLCSVQGPECHRCPLDRFCLARAAGRAAELPVPGRRTKVKEERFLVLVLRLGSSTLLLKRPEKGLLAGLWEFPRVDPGLLGVGVGVGLDGDGDRDRIMSAIGGLGAIEGGLGGGDSLAVRGVERIGTVEHRFSHLIWRLEVLRVELDAATLPQVAEREDGASRWAPDPNVDEMALPRVMQKVWELVKTYELEVEAERSKTGGA